MALMLRAVTYDKVTSIYMIGSIFFPVELCPNYQNNDSHSYSSDSVPRFNSDPNENSFGDGS